MFWVEINIYVLDLEDLHFVTLKSELEVLSFVLKNHISQFTKQYMWNNDEIQFKIQQNPRNSQLSYITSKILIGDSLEDELFVCFLMVEISKLFSNLAIKITDSDGDLLLIEGSDYIPSWFSSNRLFIKDGKIIFIPKTVSHSLKDVLAAISCGNVLECNEFQNEIFKKLQPFNNNDHNAHYVKCRIPKEIAQVLHLKPQLVSLAINSLENSDSTSKMSDQTTGKDRLLKEIKEKEFVTTSVKFSRVQYAKLLYLPLPMFLHDEPYLLPHKNSIRFKEYELGFKLTFGFNFAMTNFTPSTRKSDIDGNQVEEFIKILNSKFKHSIDSEETLSDLRNQDSLKDNVTNYLLYLRSLSFLSNQEQSRKELFDCLLKSSVNGPISEIIPDSNESWLDEIQNENIESNEETEQSILLEKMLSEFQKYIATKQAKKAKRSSKISDYSPCEFSCKDDSEYFSENEFEVLETLISNPDLLMKVIERNTEAGADSHNQLLIEQLNCLKSLFSPGNDEVIPEESDDSDEEIEEDSEYEIELEEYSRSFIEEMEKMEVNKKTEI